MDVRAGNAHLVCLSVSHIWHTLGNILLSEVWHREAGFIITKREGKLPHQNEWIGLVRIVIESASFPRQKDVKLRRYSWYKRFPLHKLYWLNPCLGEWDKDIRNEKNLQISSSTANYDPQCPFHTAIPKDYVLQLYNSILHNPAALIQIKCVQCTSQSKLGPYEILVRLLL